MNTTILFGDLPFHPTPQPQVFGSVSYRSTATVGFSAMQNLIMDLWTGEWSVCKADEVCASLSTLIRLFIVGHRDPADPLLQDLMFLHELAVTRGAMCMESTEHLPAFLKWQAD